MDTITATTADFSESASSASPGASAQVVSVVSKEKDPTDYVTSHILMWSFVTAVVLAIAGFAVVAIYLFQYLGHAFQSFDTQTMDQLSKMDSGAMQSIIVARSGLWKFILQSCGVIAGVAFGFLGFALFLLGAKGDMDAAFDDSQHKVQLSRMAPGSFVILLAVLLIGICCYQRVEVSLPTIETVEKPTGAMPDAGDRPDGTPPADDATPAAAGRKASDGPGSKPTH
jgi:hypothetical protein